MTSVKKILTLLLSLSLVLLIVSCTGGTDDCKSCADGNGDGKCDVCGKIVCAECVDRDKNGKCDVCQKDICIECVDTDKNGKCDVCSKDIPDDVNDVVLIENRKAVFRIILAKDISDAVKQAVHTSIKDALSDAHNIIIDVITEGSEDDAEILPTEILIGDVTSRGDSCYYDSHTLGKQGYVLKIADSKILINAGSDELLISTIENFANKILIPNAQTNAVMTKNDVEIKPQTDYKITALKVNGNDMKDYTLAVDLTRNYYESAALSIQDIIYTRTGYWFNIVDIDNATDSSVILKNVPKVYGEESFKVSAAGTRLVIECAFDNMLEKAANRFIADKIVTAKGEIDFKDTVYTQDISVVYYEDFGAKGDGKNDDYVAMYNTHVFANECGQTVKGKNNARYYIHDNKQTINNKTSVTSIPIRTNTDWNGAKIIIDDRDIASFSGGPNYEYYSSHIFTIVPDQGHESITVRDTSILSAIVADGLNPDTTKINMKLDGWSGDLMIVPYNSSHKVFRRKGYSQHSGEAMHEVIVIDKDGNVSEETPIMFEYNKLNYCVVYKIDPATAIRVGNGTIETLDTEVNHKILNSEGIYAKAGSYRQRGINVTRSYTTVHDVTHIVSGGFNLIDRAEGKEGASVNGMFVATNANHVTFKDCIIPGRVAYGNASSYNFRATCVNKIVLDGCIQSNFWVTVDTETGEETPSRDYSDGAIPGMSSVTIKNSANQSVSLKLQWGIGGTNYCKNMEYIDSQISRYDAHAGLYNGKIINTKINGMELTGVGSLTIENVDWYQYTTSTPLLYLRSDYGYHWDGDISVKDTRAHLFDLKSDVSSVTIANHYFSNWYFGYTCAFPNITLDNFAMYSTKTQQPIPSGYTIDLFKFKKAAQYMHVPGDTDTPTVFDYIDADKDGYIDEPYFDVNLDGKVDQKDKVDLDGDGRIGNTKLKIKDYSSLSENEQRSGISDSYCKVNINVTKPPRYIKIINNRSGYRYAIVNTADKGVSDGGWYRDKSAPDTMGGFFGNTMFIYGEGEGEYLLGTNHIDQNITKTFYFINEFYT